MSTGGAQTGHTVTQVRPPLLFHRETKGRFRKRVVLANVPPFLFFVPGEHANVPSFLFFVSGEHPNVPSFRFSFRRNIRQNHPFGKPPFCQPVIVRGASTCVQHLRDNMGTGTWSMMELSSPAVVPLGQCPRCSKLPNVPEA